MQNFWPWTLVVWHRRALMLLSYSICQCQIFFRALCCLHTHKRGQWQILLNFKPRQDMGLCLVALPSRRQKHDPNYYVAKKKPSIWQMLLGFSSRWVTSQHLFWSKNVAYLNFFSPLFLRKMTSSTVIEKVHFAVPMF